jgi:glutamine synthetase type III
MSDPYAIIAPISRKKGKLKMTTKTGIALATEISSKAKEALFDNDVLTVACELLTATGCEDNENINSLLFKYSAILSSSVAAKVIQAVLTESQLSGMISDIEMFNSIGKDVLGE